MKDPAAYHAWYETPRGAWIGAREAGLMLELMQPDRGERLLDVGCGTGWFSARFAEAGLQVTGLDPDRSALGFAAQRYPTIRWIEGRGEQLPFDAGTFDHVAAVTSLCFVEDPAAVLREMWRVSRHSVVLGLLHRPSLLWMAKRGRGSYRGARWDGRKDVRRWVATLSPEPSMQMAWAVFLPQGGYVSRLIDTGLPSRLPLGGFMAIVLRRASSSSCES